MKINKEILDKEFCFIHSELTNLTKVLIKRYENKNEPSTILSEAYIYLIENIEKLERIEDIKIFSIRFIKSSLMWKNSSLNIKAEAGKGCKDGVIKKTFQIEIKEETDGDSSNLGFKRVFNNFLVNEFENDFEALEDKIIEEKKETSLKVLKEHYREQQKDPILKTVFRYYVDERQNTVRKVAETFSISKRMANITINNLLDDMRSFAKKNGYFDFMN
jgi:hypothetical protein